MCKITAFIFSNFTYDDAHCEGARVIAQAAREAGVKRLIHVSALNASEESSSKFLQSKVFNKRNFFIVYFTIIYVSAKHLNNYHNSRRS